MAAEPNKGRSHWGITAALIVADVIGSGVLALPSTMANLGWFGGIGALLLLGYISLYTGQLLGRLHSLYPNLQSYSDLGAEFLGNAGRLVASTLAYTQMFGACVVFLVAMTIFTNQAAQTVQLPSVCFVTVSAALSAVVLGFAQIRDLHGIGHLACWVAGPTLYVALTLLLYQLFATPTHAHHTVTSIWPPLGAQKTTVAFMNIVLTYAGHVVYFELIAHMKQPKDFEKAVVSSQVVIITTYFAVSLLVYTAIGNDVASPFQLSLPTSITVGVADILMLSHVLISLLLNHNVISKRLFDVMARSLAKKDGASLDVLFGSKAMGAAGWIAATAIVTVCAWLLANLVPFFSDVMALLGSVAALNLTYGFPAAAALLQHHRELKQEETKTAELESGEEGKCDSEEPSARIFTQSWIEVPFCWLIVSLSAVMMVYGAVNSIQDTISEWASISRSPFGC